ncbi:MAG TPA: PEGA domain-containing protein [bacterium]|nr:PEGA domain-containing protein [bacterium]
MARRCVLCGADNPDDAANCVECGAELGADAGADVEIEVYDVEPMTADKPSYFEETLAAARESVRHGRGDPPPDVSQDPLIQKELKAGYEIRERRFSHRLRRPRNLILIFAGAALAASVIYGVQWAVARLPKYSYAEPAYVAGTNVALEAAAELESDKVDVGAGRGEPAAVLAVGGDGGKIFVDGNYVADAPAAGLRIPLGRHHVIVKRGNAVTLDETIDFKRGERYALEPSSAAELGRTP